MIGAMMGYFASSFDTEGLFIIMRGVWSLKGLVLGVVLERVDIHSGAGSLGVRSPGWAFVAFKPPGQPGGCPV